MDPDPLIREKIASARVSLLCSRPFFGSMATRLEIVEGGAWCRTAAVDGVRLFYNKGFIARLSEEELEFLFAHEVLHCCFEHFNRGAAYEARLWNCAADFVINQILVDDEVGCFIKGGLLSEKYRNWTTEAVYEDLVSELEKDGGLLEFWEKGLVVDQHLEVDWSARQQADLRATIFCSLAFGKGSAGGLPVALSQRIQSLAEPKLNWRELLQVTLQSALPSDFTYQRPSRKTSCSGIILPGLKVESGLQVCVAIDTSGSIGPEDCREFVSEVAGILSQFARCELRVWCFDTKVFNEQIFSSENYDEIAGYNLIGGGGTSFSCNWEYMKQRDIVPERFIMFTDGYSGDDWGDPDYCETLFVIKTHAGQRGAHPVSPHGVTVSFSA
jgi:predicted metal-dependent peptidase